MDIFKKEAPVKCCGQLFRYRITQHFGSKGEYVATEKFVPLKRKSCPGCDYCGWICEFKTWIDDGIAISWPDTLQDFDICKLGIINEGTDWETGYVDEWDLYFVKVDD